MSSKLESDVCCRLHLVKATEVTAGLAESNGSLLSGLWRHSLHVTCGLTACTLGSALGSITSMGKLYLFTIDNIHTINMAGAKYFCALLQSATEKN